MIAAALVLAAAPLSAAPSLEALKGSGWLPQPESFRAAPAVPAAPGRRAEPPAIQSLQVQVYERTGYVFLNDAENALRRAKGNLQLAGIAVMNAEVIRGQSNGFRISYLEDRESFPPRAIETYQSPAYRLSADAERELRRTENSLRTNGYYVVLGDVFQDRSSGLDYHYRVDFIAARGNQPQTHVLTSRLYPYASLAQQDMHAAVSDLQARGYLVHQYQLYQDARSRQYFFQIRYSNR